MAKYFGVTFYKLSGDVRSHVHQKSKPIFDLKDGDHGYHPKEGYHYFDIYFRAWLPDSEKGNVKTNKFNGFKITMRDNKQFFDAEVEDEKN